MRDNISPNVWGYCGWTFLKSIALSYPHYPSNEDKKKFKHFFRELYYFLPCESCRENYKKYQIEDKDLKNKQSLYEWILKKENIVSKKNISIENSLKELGRYSKTDFDINIIFPQNLPELDNTEERNYEKYILIILLCIIIFLIIIYRFC